MTCRFSSCCLSFSLFRCFRLSSSAVFSTHFLFYFWFPVYFLSSGSLLLFLCFVLLSSFCTIYFRLFFRIFALFRFLLFVCVALIPLLLSHTIPLIPRFFPSIFSFLTFFSSCLTFLVIFLVFFLHLLSQISFYFSTVAATDFIHLRLLCCTTFFIIVSYCEVFFSFFIG